VRRADNHLHVPTVLKSGSLNLLEPSGPVPFKKEYLTRRKCRQQKVNTPSHDTVKTTILMTVTCHSSHLGYGTSFVPWKYISDNKYGSSEF
jgi:hypothetical protein